MKKLFLYTLLCCCSTAHARLFEIALNGGLIKQSKASGAFPMEYGTYKPVIKVQYLGSLKMLLHIPGTGIIAGLGVDAHNIAYRVVPYAYLPNNLNYVPDAGKYTDIRLAHPAMPMYAYIGTRLGKGPLALTVAVNAGIVLVPGKYNHKTADIQYYDSANKVLNGTYTSEINWGAGFGWMAGFDLAAVYFFTKQLGLGLEFQPRYYSIRSRDYRAGSIGKAESRSTALPLSLTLRFAF